MERTGFEKLQPQKDLTQEGMLCVAHPSDLIKEYNKIIYKTSNQEFGKTAEQAKNNSKFGLSGKFTQVR